MHTCPFVQFVTRALTGEHMTTHIQDFEAYRREMNEKILVIMVGWT